MKISLFLLAWLGGAGLRAGPPPSATAVWEVVVRPVRFDPILRDAKPGSEQGSVSFWVGLRNASAVPRAFCMLGVRYSYELADGAGEDRPSEEYPVVGSPHPCANNAGHLVLPGETYFVRVHIPPGVTRSAKTGFRFQVLAEESCVGNENCPHQPITAVEPAGRER